MKEFFQDYFRAHFQFTLLSTIFNSVWFTKSWYDYIFGTPWDLRKIICRARGHAGVVFYNSSGYEPDMTCKFCDDDLG